jgi:hypothetical protein
MAKFLPLTRAIGLAITLILFGVGASAFAAGTGTGTAQVADAAKAGQAYTGLRSLSARPAAAPDPATAKILDQGAKAPKGDANVYITPQHVPKGDLLEAYSSDGATTAKARDVTAPGLLGIASQAYRAQKPRQAQAGAKRPYSLADAMRDAIWRKKTAAKLKSLTR